MHTAGGRTAVILWLGKSEIWGYQGSMAPEEDREFLEGTREMIPYSLMEPWGVCTWDRLKETKDWDGLPPKEQSFHF